MKPQKKSPSKATQLNVGCDFMAIGAHADDIEIGIGGTVAKLVDLGHTGVIVDMTDASAGTRGTPEQRLREAAQAAKTLGVARENLGLPDGRLTDTIAAQDALIRLLRKWRPKILLTHHFSEEHPDHEATAHIVKAAQFRAGLSKLPIPGEAWRPKRLFHWIGMELHEPDFAVDVSEYWKTKLAAIACFHSQVLGPASKNFQGKTDLSTPAFLDAIEVRGRFFGARIKRRYGEAFVCTELPEVNDLTSLGLERFPH